MRGAANSPRGIAGDLDHQVVSRVAHRFAWAVHCSRRCSQFSSFVCFLRSSCYDFLGQCRLADAIWAPLCDGCTASPGFDHQRALHLGKPSSPVPCVSLPPPFARLTLAFDKWVLKTAKHIFVSRITCAVMAECGALGQKPRPNRCRTTHRTNQFSRTTLQSAV